MRCENHDIAIISGFTAFEAATGAHGQQAARRIALKSGESTELRNYYFVQHCQSIMIGKPVLDVLEGPQLLALIDFPDLGGWLGRIATSVENIAGTQRGETEASAQIEGLSTPQPGSIPELVPKKPKEPIRA